MPIDPNLDVFARTIVGEARGEGLLDMLAVAAVVRERVLRPGWWGDSYQRVCRHPFQFSCWNKTDPNREVCLHAETLARDSWQRAIRIAEYTIHFLRDRDVMQLFGVDEVGRIPTHYFSRPLKEPPKSWGDQLEEIVPPWQSAFRFYVVYQGRPPRRRTA